MENHADNYDGRPLLIRPSVRPSVRPSARPSVDRDLPSTMTTTSSLHCYLIYDMFTHNTLSTLWIRHSFARNPSICFSGSINLFLRIHQSSTIDQTNPSPLSQHTTVFSRSILKYQTIRLRLLLFCLSKVCRLLPRSLIIHMGRKACCSRRCRRSWT